MKVVLSSQKSGVYLRGTAGIVYLRCSPSYLKVIPLSVSQLATLVSRPERCPALLNLLFFLFGGGAAFFPVVAFFVVEEAFFGFVLLIWISKDDACVHNLLP